MISDRPIQAFEVIVVPFPYSDRLAEKRRPALVVSNDSLHSQAGVLWIAMITGAGKESRRGDVLISDLSTAGLSGPSMMRLSKLATIEPTRILRTIGHLHPEERQVAVERLSEFLAKA